MMVKVLLSMLLFAISFLQGNCECPNTQTMIKGIMGAAAVKADLGYCAPLAEDLSLLYQECNLPSYNSTQVGRCFLEGAVMNINQPQYVEKLKNCTDSFCPNHEFGDLMDAFASCEDDFLVFMLDTSLELCEASPTLVNVTNCSYAIQGIIGADIECPGEGIECQPISQIVNSIGLTCPEQTGVAPTFQPTKKLEYDLRRNCPGAGEVNSLLIALENTCEISDGNKTEEEWNECRQEMCKVDPQKPSPVEEFFRPLYQCEFSVYQGLTDVILGDNGVFLTICNTEIPKEQKERCPFYLGLATNILGEMCSVEMEGPFQPLCDMIITDLIDLLPFDLMSSACPNLTRNPTFNPTTAPSKTPTNSPIYDDIECGVLTATVPYVESNKEKCSSFSKGIASIGTKCEDDDVACVVGNILYFGEFNSIPTEEVNSCRKELCEDDEFKSLVSGLNSCTQTVEEYIFSMVEYSCQQQSAEICADKLAQAAKFCKNKEECSKPLPSLLKNVHLQQCGVTVTSTPTASPTTKQTQKVTESPSSDMTPIIIGGAVGALAIIGAGLGYMFMKQKKSSSTPVMDGKVVASPQNFDL